MKVEEFATDDGVVWAVGFTCPGCGNHHHLPVQPHPEGHASWGYNNQPSAPTLHPSILARFGVGQVCHSWVREGNIEFLNDCTHAWAGKTVELREIT